MTSTTRTPTGQDLVCLVCHKNDNIDIDHVVNRGMGGSKQRDVPENKVPLCRECHELKTLGRINTSVVVERTAGGDSSFVYVWAKQGATVVITVPVEVSQRYKCLVGRLSDGAEGSPVNDSPKGTVLHLGGISGSPSASSLKEESDDLADTGISDASGGDGGRDGGDIVSSLTHDQRVAIAAKIKDTEWNRQWVAGDTANAWRAELGEEAEQYISDFGYVQESIANIMYACEQIPPAFRNAALRFSHHLVVLGLNREDMDEWLDKCVEEGWSVAEFRRQVKGERPRVKRWTLEELRKALAEYRGMSWEDGRKIPVQIEGFHDWLGEQE